MNDYLKEQVLMSCLAMSGGKLLESRLDAITVAVDKAFPSLPSADDLDRVAEEESVREATNG